MINCYKFSEEEVAAEQILEIDENWGAFARAASVQQCLLSLKDFWESLYEYYSKTPQGWSPDYGKNIKIALQEVNTAIGGD